VLVYCIRARSLLRSPGRGAEAPRRPEREGIGSGQGVVAVRLDRPGGVDDEGARADRQAEARGRRPLVLAVVPFLIEEQKADPPVSQRIEADIELVDPLQPSVVAGSLAEIARGVAVRAPRLSRRPRYS
jgi:hypothetical protein